MMKLDYRKRANLYRLTFLKPDYNEIHEPTKEVQYIVADNLEDAWNAGWTEYEIYFAGVEFMGPVVPVVKEDV